MVILSNPGVTHSVPTAFIMNDAVGMEWVTPGLPRMNYGMRGTECKMQQLWGCFIDVRNTNDCHMKFDNVRISFTREKYWYEIRDVFIPVLYAL